MTSAEFDNQKPYEHSMTRVRPGEAFSFTPVLERAIETYSDYTLIDTKPFVVEGIGTGQISVMRYPIALDTDPPLAEPAGHVEPIGFDVTINNVEEKDLDNIEVTMEYRGQTYFGEPAYDEVAIIKEGKAELMFYHWIAAETEEECQPMFPPDSNILSQVRFSITRT